MKLQKCEVKVMLAKNKEKRATKKLESLKADYKAIDEKYASYVTKENARKLIFLDKENVGLSQLVSQKERGGGPSLYPLPILCNPKRLKETSATLNPCPFCDLCYTCHNYVFFIMWS
jgi:hypothetical protein